MFQFKTLLPEEWLIPPGQVSQSDSIPIRGYVFMYIFVDAITIPY